MKQSLQRFAGPVSFFLVACALFAACGGLDPRKVTRGPDQAVGGDGATEGGSGPGPKPGSGGSESSAGGGESKPDNPFGGDTFSGGAPPVVDGPPEVVKVNPVDSADDAEPDDPVSLLFSEGLDEATVIADNIKIMDGDTEVEGELSYAGVVATFAPTNRLALLASYDVSVSQDVTDTAGQGLKEAFSSSFTVRDGVWGKQTSAFAEQELWGREHDSAIDARGNTLVVWSRRVSETDSTLRIVARWYRATTGWQKEVTLEAATGDCYSPRVAVSPEGDAAVVWLCADAGGYLRPFVRRFVDGDWEASAVDVSSLSTDINAYSPAVAIGGGQVVISWPNSYYYAPGNYTYYSIQGTGTSLTGAWPDYPTAVDSAYDVNNQGLGYPSITVDAKGNAITAFSYYDYTNGTAEVHYSRKAAAGSWQSAAKIPNATASGYAYGPFVVSDGEGAMAIWADYDAAGDYRVMGSRYTKAKQFASPVMIGDPDLTDEPRFSDAHNLASNGKSFFATWGQRVGNSYNACANRYDIATGKWDALPTVVSDGEAVAGLLGSIGVDGHGNALVVFDQEGPIDSQLMYARFSASDGAWQPPVLLAEDGHAYDDPMVGVADNGVGSVVFRGGGGREGQPGASSYIGGQLRIFK